MDVRIRVAADQSVQPQITAASQLSDVVAITFVGVQLSSQADLTPLQSLQRIQFADPVSPYSLRHVIFPTNHVHVHIRHLQKEERETPVPAVMRVANSTASVECVEMQTYMGCVQLLQSMQVRVIDLSLVRHIPADYVYEAVRVPDTLARIPLLTMRQVATFIPDDIQILRTILRAELACFRAFSACAERCVARTFLDDNGFIRMSWEAWPYSSLPFVDISRDTLIVHANHPFPEHVDKTDINHLYVMYTDPSLLYQAFVPYALSLHGTPSLPRLPIRNLGLLLLRYAFDVDMNLFPHVHTLILSDSQLQTAQSTQRLDSLTLHASSEIMLRHVKANLQTLTHVRTRSLCLQLDCAISDESRRWMEHKARQLVLPHGYFVCNVQKIK